MANALQEILNKFNVGAKLAAEGLCCMIMIFVTDTLCRFPILSEVMSYHSQSETVKFSLWNFSDVLNRLLVIVSQPIHEALSNEKISFSTELVDKTCRLISCVVSELSSLKGGAEAGLASIATRVSLVTPNRFTRTSPSR